jgi:hypothetical protein
MSAVIDEKRAEISMVLVSAADTGRGDADQGLRFSYGRAGAVVGSYRVRGSHECAGLTSSA